MTTTNQRAVEEAAQVAVDRALGAVKQLPGELHDFWLARVRAHAAERLADGSTAGFSWNGHMVHGDRASIEAVKESLTTGTPGWRPISEAPRDGTEIIAYGTRFGDWGYTDDQKCWTGVRWNKGARDVPAHWEETLATPRYSRGFAPTHFMPLPPPPGEG